MNRDKRIAITQAKEILSNPDQYLILDTETTGLYNCEIVQLAIMDLNGTSILDTLVRPNGEISPGSTAIHGITADKVKDAPTFTTLHPLIESALSNKLVLIYNAGFDDQVLHHCCKINNLNYLEYESICVMELYSQFCGELHPYFHNYKWQKLPGGDHTAIGDCQATLEVLQSMASTLLEMGELEAVYDEVPY